MNDLLLTCYVERPKTYAKGPAVMSKSDRTKRRYAKDFKNQTRVDGYMARRPSGSSQIPEVRRVADHSLTSQEPKSSNSAELEKGTRMVVDSDLPDGNTAATHT